MPQAMERRRVYQDWPGNDTFFCGGKLMAGPAWTSLFGTTLLVLGPSVVFCVLVVPQVAEEYNWVLMAVAVWLAAFSIAMLLVTGCSDPGIIPPLPPPGAEEFPNGRPRMKDVEINGKKVMLKWNDSCNFYQPPRAHHCSVNNDCIEKFDHHCPWVGTTIGQRNYRTFLLFVFNTAVLCCYVFAISVLQVHVQYSQQRRDKQAGTRAGAASVSEAIRDCPAAIACMCYVFLAIWFVGGLAGFHTYLVSTNQTTYENFRYSYARGENPYDRGCLSNCLEVWGTPPMPRKVDFTAWKDEWDKRPWPVNRDGMVGPKAAVADSSSSGARRPGPPGGQPSSGRDPRDVELSNV